MAPVNWRELRKNLVTSDLSNMATNLKKRKRNSKEGELVEKTVSTSAVIVSESPVSGIPFNSAAHVSIAENSSVNLDVPSSLPVSSPPATTLQVHSFSMPISAIEMTISSTSTASMSSSPLILPSVTSFVSLPLSSLSTRVITPEIVSSCLTSIFHMTPSSISISAGMLPSSSRLPPLPPPSTLTLPPLPPPLPRVLDFQSKAMSKRLEHTSGRPDMGSLWGLDFKPSDVLGDDFMEECDKQMMEKASMRDNFQSAEVFLLRTLGLLRHDASKYDECFAMARHTQSAVKKVMVLKEDLSKEHAKCIDMIVAFSAAIKSNSTLSEKVDLLMDKFQRMKEQGDDLFNRLIRVDVEKKVIKEKLSEQNSKLVEDNSALQAENNELKKLREEISRLRVENGVLKRTQAEKDELINTVVFKLGQFDVDIQSKFEALDISMKELDSQIKDLQDTVPELKKLNEEKDVELLETKTRVAAEHKKGFEKVVRQTLHFYPEIDLDKFDLFKDVFDGELVNESELEDEDEE